MPDVREFQKVVEAAEQAAAAGDIAAAEALLREAAELQEASHGPLHPDLASTFNNLAVVCEMAHTPIDTEQFYRRADAIASWSLSPGHAMVATARDNLRDFCVARGLPIEEWMDLRTGAHVAPPTPASPVTPPAEATARVAPPPPARVPAVPAAPPVPSASPRAAAAPRAPRPGMPAAPTPAGPRPRRGLGVAVAVVAVLAVLAVARVWRAPTGDRAAPPEAEATVAGAPAEAPAAAPATAAPVAPATTPSPEPPPTAVTAAAPASPDAPAAPAGVRVVTATVCSTLSTGDAWRCTAAGPGPGPGRVSYYTRVASPRGLRVQHGWYHDDRLRHDVVLNVGANAAEGYRTFSRQTVAPGAWRVELRVENGAVLDEARFVVR